MLPCQKAYFQKINWRMEEKGMNVEDTWRSFLTTVSLGINFGLLEFIKEINETRASMANERNLQRQYEILGRFGTSAEGVINAPEMCIRDRCTLCTQVS